MSDTAPLRKPLHQPLPQPLPSPAPSSNPSKSTFCSNPKKLILLQFFLLGLVFLVYQLHVSIPSAHNLPAMANAFRHIPNQNLPILLSKQVIFALRTPDTQYAYCGVPKNGCSYHIGLLHRINGVQDYEKLGTIHNVSAKSDMDITRFSNKEIVDWLRDVHVPKYIVVRNPMTRTLSAYIDKVERYLTDADKNSQAFADWIELEFPVGSGKDETGRRWNAHWRAQTYFCGFRTPNIHKAFRVLRFEHTEEIVDYLYSFVPRIYLDDGWGGDANVSMRDFMLGPRKRTGNTEDRFLEYFTNVKVFDRLARELALDIEMLDYRQEVEQLREKVVAAELDRKTQGE